MKLRDALDGCSLGLLREIAERRGVSVTATTLRRELLDRVASALLLEPAPGLLAGLGPAELRLLGRACPDGLAGARARRWLRTAFAFDDRASEGAVRELVTRGLLFRTFRLDAGERGEWLIVPNELAAVLACHVPAEPAPPAPVGMPTQVAAVAEPALDLVVLAHALARTDGRPSAELLESLPITGPQQAEPGGRAARWRFLTRLCLRLGWLSRRGERLVAAPRLGEALSRPATVPGQLWRAFRLDNHATPRGDFSTARGVADPAPQRLRDALAELGDGWYELNAVIEWMFAEALDSGEPAGARQGENGDLARAAFSERARALLKGELAWLGLLQAGSSAAGVDLMSPTGRDPGEGPEREGVAERTAHARMVDDTLEVSADCDLATLLDMSGYLKPVAVGRWQLDRASFVAGLAADGSAAHASVALLRLTGNAAAPWEQQLAEWERRAHGAEIGRVTLLDLSRHPDRDSLLADPKVLSNLRLPVEGGLAIVNDGALETLRARLLAHGVLLPASPARSASSGGELSLGRETAVLLLALLDRHLGRRPGARITAELEAVRATLRERAGPGSSALARRRLNERRGRPSRPREASGQ